MESNEPTQQRASVDPHDPLLGRVLDGRYRIESRVARGGMAAVYVANDLRLDRTVAVKVMHPGMGEDTTFVERFVREARAAARLTHPNIVSVHDQGEDDGVLFLAMEYVPGHTLRDVIRTQAPLSPDRALAQIEPVIAALAAAHRAGLIHRDVKPENVLISADGTEDAGQVKVADFGLAKAVNTATAHTATGVVIGSVSYLAPELVEKGRADERVDVYALGVVLFELLTGRKPHEGDSPIQIAYAHVHADIAAPSTLVPGIPDYVDALVARATARDADQRPADAGVLLHQVRLVAQTLRDGIAHDPELAAELQPRIRSGEWQSSTAETAAAAPVVSLATDALVTSPLSHESLVQESAVEHTSVLAAAPLDASGPVATTETPLDPAAAVGPTSHGESTTAAPELRRLPAPTAIAEGDQGSRNRRGPAILLAVVALVAAASAAAWWFGMGRYDSTPNVVELSKQEAITALETAGLVVEEGTPAYSEEIGKGLVLDSSPAPGERILEGDTVELVMSLGPERYDVPALKGMEADAAREALAEVKLELGNEKRTWHETVPEGQIISTTPEAGTTVRPGTAVNVSVSKGRKPIEITDHEGKKAATATRSLKKAGLEVRVEERFSDDVAEGVVMSQSPSNGTLFKGDTVTLVVSQGPELVEVPSVRSMGLADAKAKLEALGFKVETRQSAVYLGLQFVADSDPKPGSMARKGSTITLSLV